MFKKFITVAIIMMSIILFANQTLLLAGKYEIKNDNNTITFNKSLDTNLYKVKIKFKDKKKDMKSYKIIISNMTTDSFDISIIFKPTNKYVKNIQIYYRIYKL